MAYIIVPDTFLTAKVLNMRITSIDTHAIITLKTPMRGTNRAGAKRPSTLEPFKMTILTQECHDVKYQDKENGQRTM